MKIVSDQFQVKIFEYSERSLVSGRSYLLLHSDQKSLITITAIKHHKDDHAVVNISTKTPIQIDDIDEYVLTDLFSQFVLGKCIVTFSLYRAKNLTWQNVAISKKNRAQLLHQTPLCIWFTGLSGAGKSSIADALEKELHGMQLNTYLLDGDNLRHGLNRDLGFTEAGRAENIRRAAEVAYLMVDAGLIVLASFISPYKSERLIARKLFEEGEFIEVFVDAPLSLCEIRDPKGLYAKCRRGEIKNFTGISSSYEPPECPELTLDTSTFSVEECVDKIIDTISIIKHAKAKES